MSKSEKQLLAWDRGGREISKSEKQMLVWDRLVWTLKASEGREMKRVGSYGGIKGPEWNEGRHGSICGQSVAHCKR